ncbi:MAG: type III-B CRISPR module RAMP protein Cmr6, partial [Candidatus Electrothrix sp. MAN1_4]|nr:type III-B CRISPR module RAMP protein Cmr6 [Candidatus Electrothrix sp. MAN1_4]
GTRLFIGLGMAHVLETQVCRHPVYGMPYIPGSALKGLARAEAKRYARKQKDQKKYNDVVNILFGLDCNDSDDPDAEASTGYLIFHDAWWIPAGEEGGCEKKPYVPEIVTVHAVEYYKNQGEGAPHPDMESPNPNQQLAVQGSFYFVVEGVSQWATLGMKFLTIALQEEGVGGKVAAGYGYFVEDQHAEFQAKLETMTPKEKLRATVENWDIATIPRKIGKNYNSTKESFGDSWQIVVGYLWEIHGEKISGWEQADPKSLKRKAFKKLSQDKNAD